MALAMLPTKSLQHCQDQMIRANISSTKNIRKKDNLYISKLKIFLIKMHEGSTIKRNTDHTCFYMNLE